MHGNSVVVNSLSPGSYRIVSIKDKTSTLIQGSGSNYKSNESCADEAERRYISLMIEEQETHVNFMRGDDRAVIYTSDTTMMTKLNKLVELDGTEWKLESESKLSSGKLIGKTYSCPVSFITFRSKRIKRTYTDEQRKKMGDMLHKRTRNNDFAN